MKDFVAIDFETANQDRSSICSVGAVLVRRGFIATSFYSLVKPEPGKYAAVCQNVHGLSNKQTKDAATFPEIWKQISKMIGNLPLVAHNAPFDESCLKAAFERYGMQYPNYKFFCTLKASREHFGDKLPNHQLQTVAEACGYHLEDHHNAIADAEACAHIAIKIL